jgi:hypothetical protein
VARKPTGGKRMHLGLHAFSSSMLSAEGQAEMAEALEKLGHDRIADPM